MGKAEQEAFKLQNSKEFSALYNTMNFISARKAEEAAGHRASLLDGIFKHPGAGWCFDDTKLFIHDISPGCRLCGEGQWSCLFVNGICNASCFYCPSTQKETGQPMTNTLTFENPDDYAEYVEKLGMKAVAFSGGEPFMTFDRVLLFLNTLRRRINRSLYIWMYTNGLLTTPEKLRALRDGGLDEIRFDLSANHYSLDALKMAIGIIPKVTVEIPAIPEDVPKITVLMRQLADLGVNYLNLHQIRCTHYNQERLQKRNYTFVHGPKVTVLESELAVLELIHYAQENNIKLPVNYCSFTYRHQFQGAASRQKSAPFLQAAYEALTGAGYIRNLSVAADSERVDLLNRHLMKKGVDATLWRREKNGPLFFHPSLAPLIDFSGYRLRIVYHRSFLQPFVTFQNVFKEIDLNDQKKMVAERRPMHLPIWLEGEHILKFFDWIGQAHRPSGFDKSLPREVFFFEYHHPGLADYF